MSASQSSSAAVSISISPSCDRCTNHSSQARPQSISTSTFKLRPRSNNHPLVDAAGFAIPTAASSSQEKPLQHGAHTMSTNLPIMHPSSEGSAPISPIRISPPVFASFFGSEGCTSPIKKQRTRDRIRLHLSPNISRSESEDSPLMPPGSPPVASTMAAPMFPPLMTSFPSTPTGDSASLSNGKRSLPQDEGNAGEETPNPFTPRGRQMMQNLCVNSPSPTLSPMSPTPGTSSSNSQVIHQNLPSLPIFSFSPSLKDCVFPKRESILSNAADSSVRDTILYSAGSTPLGTPKRGLRSDGASANSSPFNSVRVQRTPIGHQRGSVFKTLPPRIEREDTASSDTSVNENIFTGLKSTPPRHYPNGREDSVSSGASVNESLTFSSLSPRVVPLTVISRNGSPTVASPGSNMPLASLSPGMPSPLMLSLDQVLKNDGKRKDAEDMHNSLLSPRLSLANYVLPRVKLTPRGKNNFASAKPDPSPEGASDSFAMPKLTLLPAKERYTHNIVDPASSFVMDGAGDKEAAEMDSLLNGFENHKAAHDKDDPKQEPNICEFDRVESEEAEMVALTQEPFQMPDIWLPPSGVFNEKNYRRSSYTYSDGSASHSSSDDQMPLPSIMFNLQPGQDAQSSQSSGRSPSFLPRPVPVAQNKSRSLFDTSNTRDGALERILQADAIAEAARSNEPLTDEDSDTDGDDADFLLCLPRVNQESEGRSKSLNMCPGKMSPFKPSCPIFCAESPLFNRHAGSPAFNKSRSGSFMRRSKYSEHGLSSRPTTPTIFEEGFASLEKSTMKKPFHPLSTHEGIKMRDISDATFTTFGSLSDCDSSEIRTSPNQCSRTKTISTSKDRQSSVCSLLSLSSLCGLDLVHEASTGAKLNDKVSVFLRSESSEFCDHVNKPLPRSELSMNSLGMSVDSTDASIGRDLFTPPVVAGGQSSNRMCSPPPLQCRGY